MVRSAAAGKTLLVLSTIFTVVGCGGPSRMERALSEKDAMIHRQNTELAEERERQQEMERQNAEIRKQNTLLGENLKQAGEQNARATMETRDSVRSLQDQLAALQKGLGSQKGGDIEVVSGDKLGTITIRVASTVLFSLGSDELKTSAHTTLDKVAQALKTEHKDNSIRIEGHTDSSPVVRSKDKFADNMVLSQARAKSVYDYMVKQAGIPANRLYTAGYSYYQPLVWPEKTTADKAKNRRVDIVILPNIKVEKKRDFAQK